MLGYAQWIEIGRLATEDDVLQSGEKREPGQSTGLVDDLAVLDDNLARVARVGGSLSLTQ